MPRLFLMLNSETSFVKTEADELLLKYVLKSSSLSIAVNQER